MTPEHYMRQAIAAARQSVKDGGAAIGAVLVDTATGRVVATGESLVKVSHDPTAHAEIGCIRTAAHELASDDLYGHTLISTLEPCHMCLSAAAWARISTIYFGAYRNDVDPSLFDLLGSFSDEQEAARMNLREQVAMTVTGGILGAQCAKLLAGYRDGSRHST
jgi:guanine deaminase